MDITWAAGGLIGAGFTVASTVFTLGMRWSITLFHKQLSETVSPINEQLSMLNTNMKRVLDRQDRQGEKLEKNRDRITKLTDEKVAWEECRDVREEGEN